MATTKIKLVQGDSRPQIKCVITDQSTDGVINIAGATVRLKFREKDSIEVLFTLIGNLLAGLEAEDGTVLLDSPYETIGVGGRVVFVFGPTDLNVRSGAYEGEIEVTFPDETVQTIYTPLAFTIREQF